MATLIFTDEMMAELAANPYVIKVTRHNIYFSGEFKQLFFKKMCEGEPEEDFFRSIGIDPDILGGKRIAGLKHNIRKTIRLGKEIADPKLRGGPSSWQENLDKTFASMRHEIAYLRQENDFLKKILSAGSNPEE